jgi:hypothetical protein
LVDEVLLVILKVRLYRKPETGGELAKTWHTTETRGCLQHREWVIR